MSERQPLADAGFDAPDPPAPMLVPPAVSAMPGGGFAIPAHWTFRDDGVAAGFDRHVEEQLPWYRQATGAMAHVARHYIPESGLIYDIGASTGNVGRALAPTLEARRATLIPIEAAQEMAARYDGPQPENMLVKDAREIEWRDYDLAVCFLTLMFVPVADRPALIGRLRARCRPGGALLVFDKAEPGNGYAATVLWRLALAGKVATGVPADEIVAKELSLGGVQRPLDPKVLGPGAVEFFRFGDFAGWLVEG